MSTILEIKRVFDDIINDYIVLNNRLTSVNKSILFHKLNEKYGDVVVILDEYKQIFFQLQNLSFSNQCQVIDVNDLGKRSNSQYDFAIGYNSEIIKENGLFGEKVKWHPKTYRIRCRIPNLNVLIDFYSFDEKKSTSYCKGDSLLIQGKAVAEISGYTSDLPNLIQPIIISVIDNRFDFCIDNFASKKHDFNFNWNYRPLYNI